MTKKTEMDNPAQPASKGKRTKAEPVQLSECNPEDEPAQNPTVEDPDADNTSTSSQDEDFSSQPPQGRPMTGRTVKR